MDDPITILSVIVVSAITFFLGNLLKKGRSKKKPTSPPENTAADIARGTIQQTFEDEVSEIDKGLKSNAPARRLANLANARKRRK
jgi:hypothetical protein